MKNIILVLSSASLLSACAVDLSDLRPKENSKTTFTTTGTNSFQDKHENEVYEAVRVVRVDQTFEKEIWLDCSGREEKSRLVELEKPLEYTKLISKNNIPIDIGRFRNKRTEDTTTSSLMGDEVVAVGLPDKKNGKRYVGMSVLPGDNIIEYRYETCGQRNDKEGCTKWDIQEQGEVTFDVRIKKTIKRICTRDAICSNGAAVGYSECRMTEANDIIESNW